jgi:membrane associated rhomboid family serine protease
MINPKIEITTVEFPVEEVQEETEQVFNTTYNSQIALEWCAVLASQKIEFILDQQEGEWIFKTKSDFIQIASENIEKYESERGFFEKHLKEFNASLNEIKPIRILDFIPFILCAIFLFSLFIIAGPSKNNTGILIVNGVQKPELIFNNLQWWRSITALTLHADLHHVLSNCLFLIIFMAITAESIGFGLAVFTVLLSGILGNYSTAYILVSSNIPPYHSLGASTAVFGALGIMTILAFISKKKSGALKKYTPIIAGAAMLALTGANPSSDVFAHFTGFCCGCLIAAMAYPLRNYKKNTFVQLIFYFSAAFIVFISWVYAIKL